MHTPDSPTPGATATDRTDERWFELLNDLKLSLPRLREMFVARVQETPEYSQHAVSAEELQQAASVALSLILDAMSGEQYYPRMRVYGTELGTLRARQGLSSEALMSAVRLDFPVIWAGLLEASRPEDAELLTCRAEEVWRVVDDFAQATRDSYIDTRIRMAQEESGVRQEFIAALFGAQGRLAEVRERFANAFETDSEAPYVIAAATGSAAVQLRQLASFPTRDKRVFLHEAENCTYLFWPETATHGAGNNFRWAPLNKVSCGLARSEHGLSGLAAAARVAAALSELADPAESGPKTVDRDWPRMARSRLDELGIELRAELEAQMAQCRPEEADRMRETVLCFIANGSVSDTAAELYCHRNTILNRLRRFREVTGLDLTIPHQAARIVIAWS